MASVMQRRLTRSGAVATGQHKTRQHKTRQHFTTVHDQDHQLPHQGLMGFTVLPAPLKCPRTKVTQQKDLTEQTTKNEIGWGMGEEPGNTSVYAVLHAEVHACPGMTPALCLHNVSGIHLTLKPGATCCLTAIKVLL